MLMESLSAGVVPHAHVAGVLSTCVMCGCFHVFVRVTFHVFVRVTFHVFVRATFHAMSQYVLILPGLLVALRGFGSYTLSGS